MSTGTVRGADAKEFVKCFNDVCQWNNGWDRWNDMVNLFAIEIANTVDLNHKDQRNETYKRIAAKYKPKEFEKFADLFLILVESLERNPFQDFLGQMYMELEMGSKVHGQCFTPFGVCQAMANIAMPEEMVRKQLDERGWISINDCACGAGATLIAAAERLSEMNINYQQRALFVAGDIDMTVAMMCYIQLSLIGCPGRVRIADSLMNPEAGDILLGEGGPNTWYTPLFYADPWQGRVIARWMDRLARPLRDAEENASERIPPCPNVTEKAQEAEQNAQKAEQSAQNSDGFAPKAYQMPELLTAKKTRRSMSEGQLMFDLTGG